MSSQRLERLQTYGPPPERETSPTYDLVKRFGTMAVTAGILSSATGPVTDPRIGALAARQAMVTLLSHLQAYLREQGGLEAIGQIVRLEGYVFADPDFVGHSLVLNGASEVLFDVFKNTADGGRHTRVATGSSSLPNGGAGAGRSVELSLWVELR